MKAIATSSKGDDPAPVLEVPEYTDPIGTVGEEPAPIVELPEYSNSIGTAGDQATPIVEVPEFKGGANWVELLKMKFQSSRAELIGLKLLKMKCLNSRVESMLCKQTRTNSQNIQEL